MVSKWVTTCNSVCEDLFVCFVKARHSRKATHLSYRAYCAATFWMEKKEILLSIKISLKTVYLASKTEILKSLLYQVVQQPRQFWLQRAKSALWFHHRGLWIHLGRDSSPIDFSFFFLNQVTELNKAPTPTQTIWWQSSRNTQRVSDSALCHFWVAKEPLKLMKESFVPFSSKLVVLYKRFGSWILH